MRGRITAANAWLFAVIIAARGAGFADGDAVKSRQAAFEAFPNPARQVFTGRVLKPVNLVEVIMIQLQAQWFKGSGEIAVINKPAGLRIDFTAHSDFANERMTMQPRAFMAFRNVGQAVGRFKTKFFNQFNNHADFILAAGHCHSQSAEFNCVVGKAGESVVR